jgi:hypothetical protein
MSDSSRKIVNRVAFDLIKAWNAKLINEITRWCWEVHKIHLNRRSWCTNDCLRDNYKIMAPISRNWLLTFSFLEISCC